jgi:hypothetical protein
VQVFPPSGGHFIGHKSLEHLHNSGAGMVLSHDHGEKFQ